jgi:putative ABC transport system permease protein
MALRRPFPLSPARPFASFGYLRRHILRYAWQHKFLAASNFLCIALGVAVYLSIQIANRSVTGSFRATVDAVAGRADLEARGDIDDALFPKLQSTPGVLAATPIVRGLVVLPDYPGEYLDVLGIDPLTNQDFDTVSDSSERNFDSERWFGDRDAIAVTREFAQRCHLRIGDKIRVQVGEDRVELRVSFFLKAKGADSALAAMDIGWAQELLRKSGHLTSVLFRVRRPEARDEVAGKLRQQFPVDVTVGSPTDRSAQVNQLLSGFQLNLTALSLVSLLVGAFLIYNTIASSALRRRREAGILRSLGVSRDFIRWLFLGEALLYGAIGAVLGIGVGIALANWLVQIVAQTVTNIYVLTRIEHFYIPWEQVITVAGLALAISLLAGWVPANDAARTQPLDALDPGRLIEASRRPSSVWPLISLACGICAVAAGFGGRLWFRPLAFVCAFFALLSFCLLAPFVTFYLGNAGAIVFRRTWLFRLAAGNVVRSLFRNAVTIAALAAAVGMLVSVSVMIHSFRVAVNHWIGTRLVADIFVTPATNRIVGFQDFVSPELLDLIRTLPEVQSVDTYREVETRIGSVPVDLGVVIGSDRNRPEFVGWGRSEQLFRQLYDGDTVFASEALANRLHLDQGQIIQLATPAGEHAFRVAAIYYDYTRDAGLLLMQKETFRRYWNDDRVNSLAVYLKDPNASDEVIAQVRAGYDKASGYSLEKNRTLREVVDEIFDQTFAVTYVLRFIAIFVAVVGIALNLSVLVKERERELAVFRAIGASYRQLICLILGESLFIGLIAIGLGLVAGGALSVVLTEVINRAFFGWTIPLRFPWDQLALTPLILLPAVALAGLIPATQSTRVPLADALRQ